MSVYIKGMKMPKSCSECPTCRDGTTLDGDYWLMCGYNGKPLESEIAVGKPDWCPLISIPSHGRLIDADALADIFRGFIALYDSCPFSLLDLARRNELQSALTEVINAPVIIRASKEEET